MNRQNFFKALFFGAALSLLPQAYAADIRVLVYGEHAGTDIIYHYTLVNNGAGHMVHFTIGSVDAGDGRKNSGLPPGVYLDAGMAHSFGQLTRLPTGTTFVPNPDQNENILPSFKEVPMLDPGSFTLPAQPAGWTAKLYGYKGSVVYGLAWTAPDVLIRGDVNVTVSGADAGQTLSGFSVRVPATGPGSLEPYLLASFEAEVWLGTNWFDRQEQQTFALIEKQDTLPPTLSVKLTPSVVRPGARLLSVNTAITVTDNYDPLPEIKLESITANQTLNIGDISGAVFGTNDRAFKLKPVKGRVYTVTYSATDGTGNKAIATGTVTVK